MSGSALRIAGTVNDSIVDGAGIRFTIFTQGCPRSCKGCHNPKTHDFEGGKTVSVDDLVAVIFKNPLLDGVTFSGGEPFCQPEPLCEIAARVKEAGLNIWTFTGYTYEQLLDMRYGQVSRLLSMTDVLIDGEYVEALRTLSLPWRGSSNQRMLRLRNGKLCDM